ncbi:MAG: ABC transporter permease [Nitrososphaerota archaeon]|nr:ABC transporter permease [Nitrososphaerota archaeon]
MDKDKVVLFCVDNLIWFLIIGVFITFSLLHPVYATPHSIFAILQIAAFVGPLALGLMLCVFAGDFNLSLEQIAGLSAALVCWLVEISGWNLPYYVVLTVPFIAALLIGLFQGVLIGRFGLNPFLITLTGWILWRSLKLYFSGGHYFSVNKPEYIFLGYARVYGTIHVSTIIFLTVTFLIWFILRFTKIGTWIYAVGSKPDTAKKLGVEPGKIKLLVHTVAALLAVLTGLFYVGQLRGFVQPNVADWDIFKAFIAVAVAGVDIRGGRGRVPNVLGGVLFYAMVLHGAQMLNLPWPLSEYILPGGLTLLAVALLHRLDTFKDAIIARKIKI